MQIPADSFLPPLPRQLLLDKDRDLLRPARWVEPKTPPTGRSTADARSRQELAEALLKSNQGWGHRGAKVLCERYADPRTLVVVTGQQAGLLGGPLYTLSKAIAAARWAEHLSRGEQKSVPVFWVATEDHDFAEVARCHLPLPGSEALRKQLQPDDPGLLPVGGRLLGPQVEELLEELKDRVDHPRYREWLEVVEDCCGSGSTFGEAFCRVLVRTLGDHCPLLLDAQEPTLKRLQRPWLKSLVERRRQVEEGLSDRESEIRSRGYLLQVKQQPGWSPLFLLDEDGQRRRIGWTEDDDGFTLRGTELRQPISRLLEIIQSEPERVSPGVLARPAIQDAVLGTSVSILGPGEMSYMTQAAAVHQVLEIEAPGLALRPQALVVDSRRQRQMEQLNERGLRTDQLLGPVAELELRLAELVGSPKVVETRELLRQQLGEQMNALLAQARELDPQLESACDKTRKQIDRALDAFDGRLNQTLSRQDELTRSRVEALRELCLPGGVLQERTVTSAHFPGLYGPAFVEALWLQLGLDPRQIYLVAPDAVAAADRAEGDLR